MTERNDYPVFLFEQEAEQPAGRRHKRAKHLKTRKAKNLYRLGMSCLALLLVTALVLVNGSFSQFSSGPTVADDFHALTAAAFNVEVDASGTWEPGDVYDADNYHYVAYAFDVRNESQVPVKCNINLNIAVTYEGEPIMDDITFYFCEDGGDDTDAITNFEGKYLPELEVFSYNSETDGSGTYDFPFYLGIEETKTFVLVADCSKSMAIGSSTPTNYLHLSNNNPDNLDDVHAITVTAEQAAEGGY